MALYIKFEDVRLRLVGKVRFTDNDEEENKMPIALANRLIDEAEGVVEQDFSPRYLVPFVHKDSGLYADLPSRPTRNVLRNVCELMACIKILKTDFGSGSAVDAQKYLKTLQDEYDDQVKNRALAKLDEMGRQWKLPPLPFLKKAAHNTEADDGFAGIGPLVTSESDGDFPSKQINDPAEDFFNGHIDE